MAKLSKPQQAYHNFYARQRQTGVPVLFTFTEWFDWWKSTGYWEQRGNANHEYCMTRIDKTEPWVLGNIQCLTGLESRSLQRQKRIKK